MSGYEKKLRILYVLRILLAETDENHVLSVVSIVEMLERQYGIIADRKTVYGDIEALSEAGYDIVKQRGSSPGCKLVSRDFEVPELKLLVDAVQASRFITERKSRELIAKLEKLCSRYAGQGLQRQVFIVNRAKAENEKIFYNVDSIHDAIHRNRDIRFLYSEWTVRGELRLKREGRPYVVSPWAVTWAEENYYLIAYEEASGKIKHYRVDKMQDVQILAKQARKGEEQFRDFDLAAFSKKTFGMFGGPDAVVQLRAENSLAGVIIDRFGDDVMLIPEDDTHFHVNVPVAVSPPFFGWVTGIGTALRIAGPEEIRKQYQEYLAEIAAGYEEMK